MCHCAPVLSIQSTAAELRVSELACGQATHRECSLRENDPECAPTPTRSTDSSRTYSGSTPASNFETLRRFYFLRSERTGHPCDGTFLVHGCGWEFPKSFSHRRVIKPAIVIPPLARSEALIGRR